MVDALRVEVVSVHMVVARKVRPYAVETLQQCENLSAGRQGCSAESEEDFVLVLAAGGSYAPVPCTPASEQCAIAQDRTPLALSKAKGHNGGNMAGQRGREDAGG